MAYSAILAAEIASRLMGGEPLARVCADDGMPAEAAVREWVKRRPEFAQVRSMPPAVRKMHAFAGVLAQCVDVVEAAQKTGLSKSRVLCRIQQCADAGIAVEYKAANCPTCGAKVYARKGRSYCSRACRSRADRARRGRPKRGRTPVDPIKKLRSVMWKLRRVARRNDLKARLDIAKEKLHRLLFAAVGAHWVQALELGVSEEVNAIVFNHSSKDMSGADKWRLRYRHDVFFRQREKQRLRGHKMNRRGKCRGKMTAKETRSVYASSDSCLYCEARLAEADKVLDHMDPLTLGGAHASFNLAVACADCNTRKAAKTFSEWVATLEPMHSTRAADYYSERRPPVDEAA